MYVYITSNYVLIQSRISKIHHSFRGESANFVAKPQNLLEVGPSKRGKASCRSHVRGKKMVSRERCVKVSVVHPKNDRMLNAIRKSQGLLVVRYKAPLVVVERIERICPKCHLKTLRNLWKGKLFI